jgi:enterochelin esterase-like enzyme
MYKAGGDLLFRQLERQRAGIANLEPIRFYLVAGSYETAVGGDNEAGNVLSANQRLAKSLTQLDYEFKYDERPEAHSWGLWEGTLGKALAYLFDQSS